jgi:hypothetical protein
MDIEQVIRRWLAGEKIRAIARLTGLDRNIYDASCVSLKRWESGA